MRDSREKGAGMRDQDPPSRPWMKGESESPIHGPLPMKLSTFGSVSYCVVILRTTPPHWSVRMT